MSRTVGMPNARVVSVACVAPAGIVVDHAAARSDSVRGTVGFATHCLRHSARQTIRAALLGIGAAALGASLCAGCSKVPLPNTPDAVDAAYGIPSGSVPADLRRPDGILKNGLLPAQSNG